jgi:hypothetical protein
VPDKTRRDDNIIETRQIEIAKPRRGDIFNLQFLKKFEIEYDEKYLFELYSIGTSKY